MEGKNAGMNVKRLSIPLLFFFFLKVGILLLVFIFSMVFLLNKCSLFASSTALWAESRVGICLTEILW